MLVLIYGFAQNITSNIICKIYYNMGKVKKNQLIYGTGRERISG